MGFLKGGPANRRKGKQETGMVKWANRRKQKRMGHMEKRKDNVRGGVENSQRRQNGGKTSWRINRFISLMEVCLIYIKFSR